MKKTILLAVTVLFLTGCSTFIYFERQVPPEMVPDYKPARIAFINQYDYQADSRIKDKHWEAYRLAISEFAKTLTTHPSDTVFFTFQPEDSVRKMPVSTQQNDKMIPEDIIKTLCVSHHSDMVLILDTLKLKFDWETIRDEDPDGSVSKTKNFYLLSDYFLSLYDATGSLFKRSLIDESIIYASRPTLSGLITIVPNLANAGKGIRELANRTGTRYTNMFYPGIISETRTLHSGKSFTETNALLRNHEYVKAIEKLTPLSMAADAKLAGKARHNLSVARELKQNYDEK
jgi:hypothetical protein